MYEKELGVITIIDEPTYVEDINGLIFHYIREHKLRVFPGSRFKCNYCGRILKADGKSQFACTSCGHGAMSIEKPKSYCCICGSPIYDNVSRDREVECKDCVGRKVSHIEKVEKAMSRNRIRVSGRKKTKQDVLGKIRNKKEYIQVVRKLKEKGVDIA